MGASLEAMVNAARWKAGALRYNAALQVANAGYDSDIYFGMTADPAPDYTLSAGIPFRLLLPIKERVVFDISENPQYLFFLKTEKERALNNNFGGLLHFIFDRFYFRGEARFSNVRQRMSPELTIYIRQKTDDFGGLALWQLSKGTSMALQYKSSTYKYENPPDGSYNVSASLDRRENFLTFTAYLQRAPRTRFFLAGEYGTYAFTDTVSRFKDSRSYGIYGGVEFLPSPEGRREGKGIQGTINLGFKYFNVIDPQTKGYSGPVGNTSVSIGVFKLTSVNGFFSKDIQFSASSSFAYYTFTRYGGGVSRRLSRKSRLEYNLIFSRGMYPSGPTGSGEPPQNSLLRYTDNSLGLFFQVRRDLECSILGALSNRGGYASVPAGNHFFIGINLTYGSAVGGIPMLANPFSR
jgi:hypothetical protein